MDTTDSPLRPKIFKVLRITAALLGLITIYVAVVGIAIDLSAQNKEIADKLSATLGREARVTGAVQLEISARPKLRLSGLRIANARGFGSDDFASLGEARLALNLWPLLWGRLQVEELAGSDVRLRLQVRKSGENNWTFRKEVRPVHAEAQTTSASDALPLLDIQRVSLQKLDVQYVGDDGTSHYFNLNALDARLPSGQPLSLRLNGTVERTFPYQVEFTGGTLADLIGADRPWPVAFSLNFLSSQLTLKGTLSGTSGNLHFDLATQNLNELERLLQTRLPRVGHTRMAGDVAFAPGRIQLTSLNGNVGNTKLNGALDVDYGGARPKLLGQLSLPVLDLRPFLMEQSVTTDIPARTLAEIYRDLAQASFDLHALNDVDADLTLSVGQWLNTPGAVHDVMLQVKLDHGRLTMPIRATLADAMLSGRVQVDARKSPARFEIALGTRDSSIGNLAGLLLGLPDIKGELGRFDLRVTARGNRGAELMDSLVVQLGVERAKLSYGNKTGARPVQLSLDRFMLALPAGRSLRGEAQGTLLDNAFSLSLHGASLTELLQQRNAAIDFALQAGSASAQIHALLLPPAENSGAEFNLSLNAPHSNEISSWLGLKPGADVPVSLKGDFQVRAHGWLLSGFTFHLGRSRLTAEVQQTQEQDKPLVKLRLNGELIDADELKSLLPETPAGASTQAAPSSEALIDIPILPQGVSLADADITVRIQEIATHSPFTVHDLRFDGRIRDGMMSTSPFAANVAKNDFTGAIMLDLRTRQPRAGFWLAADAINIGSLLRELDIARQVDAHVDHLGIYMDLHASRLGDLLAQSELLLSFEGGYLDLRDANTGGAMHIALDSGELKSAPGAAVHLNLNGAVDKAPVNIKIETAKAADLLNPNLSTPFKLNASTADATIDLSGDVDRPFSQHDVELALHMRGSRFDNLNSLLHTSLPPWGPWSVSGKFHMSSGGYELSSLQLQVGSSELRGHGKLDTRALPPRLDIELAAPTIQVNDFRFGNWSAETKPSAAPTIANDRAGEKSTDVRQLLSREMLQRQNAYLMVHVDQVLSGNDVLGNGQLEARLQNGRADIGPIVVNMPGGTAMLRLDYEPGEKSVALNLRAEARHFDYGILARRIDKQSKLRGTFDLDVNVGARAQNFSELLRYGNGHIDFAVWPENMKSGLLDLWAVNLLVALLPAVDSAHESTVNCAIGQFHLQDGKLSHKRILVDTTRMRVFGKGSADFTAEQIQFYMQPRAKKPQFLSFPLPVEVNGSFEEFSVGVRPRDVLETAGQFVTSFVWVPLYSLFGKTLPADGADVCQLK